MDFLDQTVQKAKEIFDVACQKTGDAVNTGKQRLDIASLESKLNKEYRLLGKLYYNTYKAGEQANFESIIQSIDSLKKQIRQKEKEISEISNKNFCHKCGKKLNQNAVYCTECGEKQI